MELTNATVRHVGTTEHISEKFRKRELLITYAENPTYPQTLKFEAVNDKCEALDELREGDSVTVHYNLNGREWTDKTGKLTAFNTLSIWKVEIAQTSAQPQYAPPVDINSAPEDDDFPF